MSDEEDQQCKPVEQVLGGILLHPFEDDPIIETVYVLAKLMDKDGHSYWDHRVTGNANREEMLGVLQIQTDLLRKTLVGDWDIE